MSAQFNNDDFKSSEGMLTSIWGPSFWHFLHTMSFNYPLEPSQNQKTHYYNFIKHIEYILPCRYCRENYPKNLKKVGFNKHVFRNRKSFSTFIYNLHNEVNTMLGKKCNLSYEKVRQRYEHFRSRCLKKESKKSKSNNKTKVKKKKKEDGCVDSFYGKKAKCIMKIVPKNSKQRTFTMNKECYIKKIKNV